MSEEAAPEGARVVVYVRVSTRMQRYRHQFRELRRYAAARGWRVVAVCRDKETGKRGSQRPGWARAMSIMRQRHARVVLAWSLDRCGRSVWELVGDVERLRAVGGRLVTLNGVDTGGVTGRVVATVLAAMAEMERELISERTRAGLEGARARGRRLGRPPLDLPPAVLAAVAAGERRAADVAREYGCAARSVRRAVAAAGSR